MRASATAARETFAPFRLRDQGWWGRHCYSESPWQVLRFALPMGLGFHWVGVHLSASPLWLGAGVVFWTLFEYFFHRFFYHWNPRNPKLRQIVHASHIAHHLDPHDLKALNAGPVFAMPMAGLLFLGLFAISRDAGVAAEVMAGNTIGYFLYELVHYKAHAGQGNRGLVGALRRYHRLHHHADWHARYGVTSPFWDFVFRTRGS